VIKDDHGIANQQCHPFEQRVTAVQKAINQANRETGGNTCTRRHSPAAAVAARAGARGERARREDGARGADARGHPAFVEMQVDLAYR
jgi:hypothetical protein